jgi:hypothetical protein
MAVAVLTRAEGLVGALELLAGLEILSLGVDAFVIVYVVLLAVSVGDTSGVG